MEVNKEQSLTDAVLESRRRSEEESLKKLTGQPEQSARLNEFETEQSDVNSEDASS
jgi:hypothetical protein